MKHTTPQLDLFATEESPKPEVVERLARLAADQKRAAELVKRLMKSKGTKEPDDE